MSTQEFGPEQKLVGAVLTGRDPRDFDIETWHFASPLCKRVWKAALELASDKVDWKADQWISPMVLIDHLGEETLGATWTTLDSWSSLIESPALGDYWAKEVRDAHAQRAIARVVDRAKSESEEMGEPSEETLQALQAQMDKREVERGRSKSLSAVEAADEGWQVVEQAIEKLGSDIIGIPSGLRALDKITSGWQPSNLVIIAARPSMGKTALAGNFLLHAALTQQVSSLFLSLEMSTKEVMPRLWSAMSGVAAKKIRTGRMDEAEVSRVLQAVERLRQAPLRIVDASELTVREIRAHARRHKPELLVLDYLQLVTGDRQESRQVEVAGISRKLKGLARELDIPVLALSQLSRKLDDRKDKHPILSDLRESGAIEQDADVVLFLHRDDKYRNSIDKPDGLADIDVAKARNGPTGRAKVCWIESRMCFSNLNQSEE